MPTLTDQKILVLRMKKIECVLEANDRTHKPNLRMGGVFVTPDGNIHNRYKFKFVQELHSGDRTAFFTPRKGEFLRDFCEIAVADGVQSKIHFAIPVLAEINIADGFNDKFLPRLNKKVAASVNDVMDDNKIKEIEPEDIAGISEEFNEQFQELMKDYLDDVSDPLPRLREKFIKKAAEILNELISGAGLKVSNLENINAALGTLFDGLTEGSVVNATITIDESRDKAISEIRLILKDIISHLPDGIGDGMEDKIMDEVTEKIRYYAEKVKGMSKEELTDLRGDFVKLTGSIICNIIVRVSTYKHMGEINKVVNFITNDPTGLYSKLLQIAIKGLFKIVAKDIFTQVFPPPVIAVDISDTTSWTPYTIEGGDRFTWDQSGAKASPDIDVDYKGVGGFYKMTFNWILGTGQRTDGGALGSKPML